MNIDRRRVNAADVFRIPMFFIWVIMTFTPAFGAMSPAAKPLAPTSIYQLSLQLTDQNGRSFNLDERRGHAVLITMFYSSCQFVCPRIVEALKNTEANLSKENHNQVPIVMVSFDAARDDSATLKAMAEQRQLDEKLWTLAHTDPRSTRKLAALLSIQYRELASGDFNHTSVLILLDSEGRIVGKTFQLGKADPTFVKLVKKYNAIDSAKITKATQAPL